MSETLKKTLKQVGAEAAENYSAFKKQEKEVGFDHDPKEPDQTFGTGMKSNVNAQFSLLRMNQEDLARARQERGLPEDEYVYPESDFVEKHKRNLVELAGKLHVGQSKLEEIAAEGERQYRDNNGEMQELAVIEAHLGGVAINVEQPIEVGVQVPVRVEHSSQQ